MKRVLENLSVALGHKGEINEAVMEAAENLLAAGMGYIEINALALRYIKLGKNLGIPKDLA
jgi:hypothetical protein